MATPASALKVEVKPATEVKPTPGVTPRVASPVYTGTELETARAAIAEGTVDLIKPPKGTVNVVDEQGQVINVADKDRPQTFRDLDSHLDTPERAIQRAATQTKMESAVKTQEALGRAKVASIDTMGNIVKSKAFVQVTGLGATALVGIGIWYLVSNAITAMLTGFTTKLSTGDIGTWSFLIAGIAAVVGMIIFYKYVWS